MFSKNKAFISFSILFILGIFINNILINIYLSFLVLLLLVILFFNFYVYTRKNLYIKIFAIIWFICGILISFYELSNIYKNLEFLDKYFNNSKYELTFEINDLYKIKDYENQYTARIIKIKNINIDKKNNINWLLTISWKFKLKKGDLIKTNSNIKKIVTNFKSDRIRNFSDFSYDKYFFSKDIYFTSYIYNYQNIWHIEQSSFYVFIEEFRNKFLEILNNIYPKEEAIFLWWILIWAKENLSNELKTDFNNSWLTHLIAVSGFNITILIIFLGYLFSYFPLFLRIIFTISSIIIFTFLVWDTAPVVRASIMWILGYLIMISWRKADILSVILLSSCIMLLFSPLILNYDVSFQLSFLAVLGIVYLSDFFKKVFKFMPEFLAIRESFVMTMSALIMTIPIMIFNFWQISIISPITNILVSWTIPIAMFFWFLSIITSFFNSFLWIIIGYFTWIFLKFDILVVHYFGNLSFWVLKTDFFWVYKNHIEVLYFLILFFLIIYFRIGKVNK